MLKAGEMLVKGMRLPLPKPSSVPSFYPSKPKHT